MYGRVIRRLVNLLSAGVYLSSFVKASARLASPGPGYAYRYANMQTGSALRTSTVYAAREPLIHIVSRSRVWLPLNTFDECRFHQPLLRQSHLGNFASRLDAAWYCWTGGLHHIRDKRGRREYIGGLTMCHQCVWTDLIISTQDCTAVCIAWSVSGRSRRPSIWRYIY